MLFLSDKFYKILHEKHFIQRKIASFTFDFWQTLGFHVAGDHFYDPIPDTRLIRTSYSTTQRELPGLKVDWTVLEKNACRMMAIHLDDYLQERGRFGYLEENNYFRGLDALYFYAFIREHRLRRIVEIGQGFSTRLALAGMARNACLTGTVPEVISVDPYNRFAAKQLPRQVQFSVISKPLQDIVNDLPQMLSAGDLLFVDLSHVFKYGSDVQVLFEKVYPRLPAKVHLHIHDVFTPFDYPFEWFTKYKRFWNEQYILESFLSFNNTFQIEAPICYISKQPLMRSILTDRGCSSQVINPTGGSSFYLRRTQSE